MAITAAGVWCVSYSLNPLTGMDSFCDLLRIYKIVKAIVDVLSCAIFIDGC
jgi:hypothetical protein